MRALAKRLARRSYRQRLAAGEPAPGVAVSYGVPLASPGEPLSGGAVKFQRLADSFPEAGAAFNVLYLGSSSAPSDTPALIALARHRGAAVVWNQDGVVYPGLAGWDVERSNRIMSRAVHDADYVFFQSEFCKRSADAFLGVRSGPWEILYNAVDTTAFTPADAPPASLVLLLGGSQYQWYRVDAALRALAALRRRGHDASLLVTGRLTWARERRASRAAEALVRELGLDGCVEFTGPYAQRDAPALLRRSTMLLHTKYNDPCPGIVIEAMACGLPVVYSASGGVPELVGDDAGVGVAAPEDFERDHPPDPDELADAVLVAAARVRELGTAARARAVERFDLQPWVARHRQVFAELRR